jgi:hypothetical protein
MANFPEVPTFIKGEPGFAAKLNQLGDALRAVIAHVESDEPKPAAKAPVRKASTKAE